MPKLPGRESTKLKLPLEGLLVTSFFMPWEQEAMRWDKHECIVEGCDHKIGNCVVERGGPAILVQAEQYERDQREGTLKARTGPGCSCCVQRLLAS